MNNLQKALQGWEGPALIWSNMEAFGFHAHRLYREALEDFCKTHGYRNDIGIYWQETAREYVSSTQLEGHLGKYRSKNGFYRSEYLDGLICQSDRQSIPNAYKQIMHEGLRYFFQEKNLGPGFNPYIDIHKKIEFHKQSEIKRFNIKNSGWTGLKSDVDKFIKNLSKELSFDEFNIAEIDSSLYKIGYIKRTKSNLNFCFGRDGGGSKNYSGNIMKFYITYGQDNEFLFSLGSLKNAVPGIEEYHVSGYSYIDENGVGRVVKSPESEILGLLATINAFNFFIKSFQQY